MPLPPWPDEYEAVPAGSPTPDRAPLATRAELQEHLDAADDDWPDAVLDAKLLAASAYIEGPSGLTGQWFQSQALTLRWYGLAATDRVALPGGKPHGTISAHWTPAPPDSGLNAVEQLGVKRWKRRWLLLFRDVETVEEGGILTLDYDTAPVDVPPAVKEACLKLAASLVVDRTLALRLDVGEGTDFPELRRLVSPFSVPRPA